MKERYDIVIAGGGMVGISLACALGEAFGDALSVLVVESFPLPASGDAPVYQPSFDARSTALSAGSRHIFERIAVWPKLASHVCPIDQIHVSTRGRPGSTLMRARDENLPALGYVVENHWLGRVLISSLARFPSVDWCAPASVTGVELSEEGRQVLISRGDETDTVACELLVIADGAHSKLARALGVSYSQSDYSCQALIANIVTEKSHEGVAFERFTDQGPMALLPLLDTGNESRSALVWTLPDELAEEMLECSDEYFLSQLQDRFGYRQGRLLKVGQRNSYALQLVEANEQIRSGVVVLGNAAHFLHPVAGQGFNLALRDVAGLVEVLAAGAASGRSLGELGLLEEYLQAQAWDQRKTTAFSDRVSEVFTWSQPLIGVARDIGLSALDVVGPAKTWFVKQAAGLAGQQAQRL